MSLAITAVTSDGIVMGVDSAVTWSGVGEQVCLTGVPKIIHRPGAVQTVAFVGDAMIGEVGATSWFHIWLNQFLREMPSSPNCGQTASELAEALNLESLPFDGKHSLMLAAWEGPTPTNRHPVVWEVSRTRDGNEYRALERLSQSEQRSIVSARVQTPTESEYPVFFFHAGVPTGLVPWIVNEGRTKFSELLSTQVPAPSVESVEEFVRFILRAAADLYRIAEMPHYVSEPVTTEVLSPEAVTGILRRR